MTITIISILKVYISEMLRKVKVGGNCMLLKGGKQLLELSLL